MKPGFYRHPNCLDIDFKITYVCDEDDFYRVSVLYWNRNYKLFIFPEVEVLKLSKETVKLFKLISIDNKLDI